MAATVTGRLWLARADFISFLRGEMAQSDVYMFLLSAVATDKNSSSCRPGDRHSIVAFVKGETVEKTEPALLIALDKNGWRDHDITKVGKAGSEAEGHPSVQDAREHGVALMVFSDPMKSN